MISCRATGLKIRMEFMGSRLYSIVSYRIDATPILASEDQTKIVAYGATTQAGSLCYIGWKAMLDCSQICRKPLSALFIGSTGGLN